jgi:hypothetical protein
VYCEIISSFLLKSFIRTSPKPLRHEMSWAKPFLDLFGKSFYASMLFKITQRIVSIHMCVLTQFWHKILLKAWIFFFFHSLSLHELFSYLSTIRIRSWSSISPMNNIYHLDIEKEELKWQSRNFLYGDCLASKSHTT